MPIIQLLFLALCKHEYYRKVRLLLLFAHDIERINPVKAVKVVVVHSEHGNYEGEHANVAAKARPEIVHFSREFVFAVMDTNEV